MIFNDCSEMFYKTYAPSIEAESGIPVLGYLPHMEEAGFESRHLGLMTAEEIDDLAERIVTIGYKMDETIDLERLIQVTGWQNRQTSAADTDSASNKDPSLQVSGEPVTIAIARDGAFNFIYEETIASFERAGAEIAFFSPLTDDALPEGTCGIYLPGGYPELYGKELEANTAMRSAIRQAIQDRMPTIAECGGFLYLSDTLEDENGNPWNMVGALPGRSANTGRLVRFGYGRISSEEDNMLLKKGEQLPVHEFHYWDTTDTGCDMHFAKATGAKEWDFGFASDTLYAGFPHLYPAGSDGLIAKRFVEAARNYKKANKE